MCIRDSIDFVQDSKSSKFRALVDGAFPKANLIIYKGIRSNQIGTCLLYTSGLFLDLQIKAYHGEISTKSLDLRGLVSAVKATRSGLSPIDAIQIDVYKRQLLRQSVLR